MMSRSVTLTYGSTGRPQRTKLNAAPCQNPQKVNVANVAEIMMILRLAPNTSGSHLESGTKM